MNDGNTAPLGPDAVRRSLEDIEINVRNIMKMQTGIERLVRECAGDPKLAESLAGCFDTLRTLGGRLNRSAARSARILRERGIDLPEGFLDLPEGFLP